MQYQNAVDLLEHAHESLWEIVLEGKIDLVIDGVKTICVKGDRYQSLKDN